MYALATEKFLEFQIYDHESSDSLNSTSCKSWSWACWERGMWKRLCRWVQSFPSTKVVVFFFFERENLWERVRWNTSSPAVKPEAIGLFVVDIYHSNIIPLYLSNNLMTSLHQNDPFFIEPTNFLNCSNIPKWEIPMECLVYWRICEDVWASMLLSSKIQNIQATFNFRFANPWPCYLWSLSCIYINPPPKTVCFEFINLINYYGM